MTRRQDGEMPDRRAADERKERVRLRYPAGAEGDYRQLGSQKYNAREIFHVKSMVGNR